MNRFHSFPYNHQWLCLQEDAVSANLLSDFDVNVLKMSSPREVSGDGNCFYRAVSLALFGTEDFHFYLRAVTAFHIIANRQLYDIRCESFVLEETCIRTPCLRNVISSALTDGDYAEMVHLFALSDALQIPIHSYCIPGTHSIPGVHPYTVRIEKNDFRCTATRPKDELAVMWTARMRPTAQTLPEPNHFTVLVPRSGATGIEEYAGTNPTHLDVAVDAAADASTEDVEPSIDAADTVHVNVDVDEHEQASAGDPDVSTVEPQHTDVQVTDEAAVQKNTCKGRGRRRKRKRSHTKTSVGTKDKPACATAINDEKRQRQVIIILINNRYHHNYK